MTSSIHDLGAYSTTASAALTPLSALDALTPRQRIDSALAQLPLSAAPGDDPQVPGIGASTALPPGAGELVGPLQRINEVMRSYGIEFTLDEHPSRVVTRIVDRVSGDVIRQIPSEEVLRIAKQLDELQGRLISLEA